jgi:hypothetical protein
MSSIEQRQILLSELRRMQREIERDHRSTGSDPLKQQPLWRRCIRWLTPRG